MTQKTDEARIKALLDQFSEALRRKDAALAVAVFAEDAVAYDLAPPLQMAGAELRDPAHIQSWFDTWEGGIASTSRHLTIRVGGDIAYAFTLQHMSGTKTDGSKPDLWFRATACFERRNGEWKITHVHNSVPFAMDGSDRALLDLTP